MTIEESVLKKIEEKRESIIGLLSELVKIPSPTGEEKQAQAFVERYFKGLGFELNVWEPDIEDLFRKYPEAAQYPSHWKHDLILPYRDWPTYEELVSSGKIDILNYQNRPNVVGKWKGTGGGRSLILNGHIDTVTIEPKEKWTVDPFGAEIKGNKMFGRGTTEMKGGFAAAIAAIECLKETGVRLRGDVIVESVVNEEHCGNGTLACIARGVVADAAIIIEPSDFEVYVAEAGNLYWEIRVKGEPRAPGARWVEGKQVGVSAIEKLPGVLQSLVDLEAEFNQAEASPLFQGKSPSSLVIGKIQGGTYETLTAAECSIRGSLYFGPSVASVKEAMARMKEAVASAASKDPWLKDNPPEVFFLHHRNRSEIDPGEPIIQAMLDAGEKALGFRPAAVGALMPADQSFYINQAKVPSVVFGPGSMAQAHRPDEYILIDDLIRGTKVLALTIYDWCR